MINLRREILERNLRNEVQGREILDYKIGETLKRNKGEKNGTVKWGRVTWERHV